MNPSTTNPAGAWSFASAGLGTMVELFRAWGISGLQVFGIIGEIMNAASSVTPLWNVLLPVLVGGAIGIVGSFVGPFFLQRLKDAADKKRKRAEKFEELVAAVAEHYHWFATMRFFIISGQGSQPTLSPITKIQAITGTYFSEFEDLVQKLDSASNDYEIWILDTGQKRLRNEPGYEKLTGHDEVVTKYTDARKQFLKKLNRFGRQHFQ